jgi:hypothetical protein
MPDYKVSQTIKDASLEEVKEIFRWVQAKGVKESGPHIVLIGGWAVYTYNQWYGSFDIDLVTNSKIRHSLKYHLVRQRGFEYLNGPLATTIAKKIDGQKIVIDFMPREETYKFEGRTAECPFTLLDKRTESRDIVSGFPVIVPEQTLLMIYKLKAAWDRSYRIEHQCSTDIEWETVKLHKDRADILSLIDRSIRGTAIDLQYLGERLHEYTFLVETLQKIPDDIDAVKSYMLNRISITRLLRANLPISSCKNH